MEERHLVRLELKMRFGRMSYNATAVAIHYTDVIMGTIASQITSLTVVYSTVYSGSDQRKHQRSASLAFVRGIHRCPVNSPHKGPVTRKMFPFDDVFMTLLAYTRARSAFQTHIQYMSALLITSGSAKFEKLVLLLSLYYSTKTYKNSLNLCN